MTKSQDSYDNATRETSSRIPRRKGVHYQLTFSIARELDFDLPEARTIAKANAEVDKCFKPKQNIRNYWRHFDPLAWLPFRRDSRDFYADHYLKTAIETGDPSYLGPGLHSLQDKFAHGLIPFQRDLPLLKRLTGTWRDNPELNPEAFEKTKTATRAYLEKFISGRRL